MPALVVGNIIDRNYIPVSSASVEALSNANPNPNTTEVSKYTGVTGRQCAVSGVGLVYCTGAVNSASAANNSTCSFDLVTADSVDMTRIAHLGSYFFQFLFGFFSIK